jgi:hypothetical protein
LPFHFVCVYLVYTYWHAFCRISRSRYCHTLTPNTLTFYQKIINTFIYKHHFVMSKLNLGSNLTSYFYHLSEYAKSFTTHFYTFVWAGIHLGSYLFTDEMIWWYFISYLYAFKVNHDFHERWKIIHLNSPSDINMWWCWCETKNHSTLLDVLDVRKIIYFYK